MSYIDHFCHQLLIHTVFIHAYMCLNHSHAIQDYKEKKKISGLRMKIKEEKKIILQSIINKSVNKKEASTILIIIYNGSTKTATKRSM